MKATTGVFPKLVAGVAFDPDNSPDTACAYLYFYQPTESVHRALKRLLALGFLECEGLLEALTPLTLLRNSTFTVRLPLEGLLVLKKASNTAGTATQDKRHKKTITINLLRNNLLTPPP